MVEQLGLLPEKLIFICTILSFLIPFLVYKVNQKLHEYGDPTWKKEDQKERNFGENDNTDSECTKTKNN